MSNYPAIDKQPDRTVLIHSTVDRRQLDILRFHGAWIYLCVAVAAGSFIGNNRGVERGMLIGTGFIGGFMFIGAAVAGLVRRKREAIIGVVLMVIMPLVAWFLDGPNHFLWILGGSAVVAIGALVIADRQGFLSTSSIVLGTAALSAAAPAAALGAGATGLAAFLLYGLLWPFFCWRTHCVANTMSTGAPPNLRPNLRQLGLREAAFVAVWSLGAAIVLRSLV